MFYYREKPTILEFNNLLRQDKQRETCFGCSTPKAIPIANCELDSCLTVVRLRI